MTEAEVRRRMARQIDPEEARRRTDFVVENDGDSATLERRARDIYARIIAHVDAS